MFNKNFKLLIFSAIIIITNTLNSYQKLEFTQAQETYYTEHNKEFLYTIFYDYPKEVFSKYDTFPIIGAATPYIALLYFFIKNKWYENYFSSLRDDAIILTIITLIITLIPSGILYSLTEYFTEGISQKDKIHKTIKWFCDNYDPDLNANINLNFKKFVPEDKYEIFDKIHEEYIKLENKYINDNLEKFIKQIINYSTQSSNSSKTTIKIAPSFHTNLTKTKLISY